MKIVDCILKIYPDWKGVVWENDYKRIMPNAIEKRETPSLKELEIAWAEIEAEPKPEEVNKDQALKDASDSIESAVSVSELKAVIKKVISAI